MYASSGFQFVQYISIQGYLEENDVELEENGALSIQIRYDAKQLQFKTFITSGHLKRGNKLKSTFEFFLPSARVNAKKEEAERKGITGFSVLKYVYHEGSSLQIDYLGFSNETWNGNIELYRSTFYKNICR